MNKKDPIQQFINNATNSLPNNLGSLREEFGKNLKQGLQHLFNDLELVSRDEFDIQSKVLEKTRQKIALLEQKMSDLENKST